MVASKFTLSEGPRTGILRVLDDDLPISSVLCVSILLPISSVLRVSIREDRDPEGDGVEDDGVEVVDLDEGEESAERSDAGSGVVRSLGDMEPDSDWDAVSVGPVYEDISEAEGELRDSPESPDD